MILTAREPIEIRNEVLRYAYHRSMPAAASESAITQTRMKNPKRRASLSWEILAVWTM
jgi:hypothetical protein